MRIQAKMPLPRLLGPLRPFLLLVVLIGFGMMVGNVTSDWEWNAQAGATALPQVSGQPQVVSAPPKPLPWYRTTWALVAYGVGALGLLALCMRSRRVQLGRQREELEKQVEVKTSEVAFQKRQLEAYNQELLRTNEALRSTVEEKSKLLGMAAHDLKNPLFGIRALAEILLENGAGDAKTNRKLNLIRDSADETLHLIDDLLRTAASSVREGREIQPVDVAALAQWVVKSFDPHVERKEQRLYCSVESDTPCVVEGDKQKLREAVDNLVSNALKYSPPGETIQVEVERRAGDVWVSVTDAGPGLSEKDQQRLFAPFQRLTPEPTGEEGSSGLGLYIVKKIVERHNGTVEVDTALGEGSTFSLVLPATTPDETPVPEAEPQELET